jgi:hypothetical protein
LVARNVFASVNVLLMSFMDSHLGMVRRIIVTLATSNPGSRVHDNVVVITLNYHLLSAAVSLVVTVSMTMAVVVTVTRVG